MLNIKKIISIVLFLFTAVSAFSSTVCAQETAISAFSNTVCAEETAITESFANLTERYREIVKSGEKKSVEAFLKNEDSGQDATSDKSEPDFSKEIKDFSDSIPKDVKDRLPYIEKFENEGIIDPEEMTLKSFSDEIKSIAGESTKEITKILPQLIIIILLAFILRCAVNLFDSKLGDAASVMISAVIALRFFSSGIINIEALSVYLTSLTNTATAIVSLLVSVLITGGNVTSAAVASSAVSVICAIIQYLFSKLVLPLIAMSLALSVAGSCGLSDFARYLGEFLRKAAIWITVSTSTLATFVLAVQSVLAKSADTVGIKTVKFAVGSFVPLVGGALSETVNTVSAGLAYIKNTCGIIGIIVLLFIVLIPVASILSAKIALLLGAGAAAVVDCKKECEMLKVLSKTADCLLALFICSGASFIIFIIGIISSSLAIR